MNLAVGHIKYLNCAPLFHYLSQTGFRGQIVDGVPAVLNHRLATGEIDVSPSSSFEYARNWRQYLLLPNHSISSWGPVKSVLLFAGRPLEELEGAEIALTGESATSVNLLRVVLAEFLHLKHCTYQVPQQPVEDLIAQGKPALLIGDRALKMSQMQQGREHVYDLGELWHRFTGSPFVFALWILRRDVASAKHDQLRHLLSQLSQSRERAFSSLESLADQLPERQWMGTQGLVDYWRCMSYDLTADHLTGLRLFFELCVKHELLAEMPELQFFE